MAETEYNARDWKSHPPYFEKGYKSTALRSPRQPLVPLAQTVSAITGPSFGAAAIGSLGADLTKTAVKSGEPIGERIIVAGKVCTRRSNNPSLKRPDLLVAPE